MRRDVQEEEDARGSYLLRANHCSLLLGDPSGCWAMLWARDDIEKDEQNQEEDGEGEQEEAHFYSGLG